MQITPQSRMPVNAAEALKIETDELRQGRKASSFKLGVSNVNGTFQVSSGEIQRMLQTARGSINYKKNFEKYQFKVITSDTGQKTLSLKEQGFFSKLKGLFTIGRAERQQQRAEASRLISDAFSRAGLRDTIATGSHMTHNDAIRLQRDLMSSSSLAPQADLWWTKAEAEKKMADGVVPPEPLNRGKRDVSASSEDVTFSKLLGEGDQAAHDTTLVRDSFETYESGEVAEPRQAIRSNNASAELEQGLFAAHDGQDVYEPDTYDFAALLKDPTSFGGRARPESIDASMSSTVSQGQIDRLIKQLSDLRRI
jgi:hypothetical protein